LERRGVQAADGKCRNVQGLHVYMHVTTPNSVAANEAIPRQTLTSRPATEKCSTLPTYLRTIKPASMVAGK
jgi:hypothetical protein